VEHQYRKLTVNMKDCTLPKIKQNPNRRRNLPKSVVSRPFLMKGPRLPFHEPDHKIFIAGVGMSSQCKQQVSKTPSLGGDASKESEKKKRNVSGVCSFHLFSLQPSKSPPKEGHTQDYWQIWWPIFATTWRRRGDLERRSLQLAEAIRKGSVQQKTPN
jgi:hypothetical protein